MCFFFFYFVIHIFTIAPIFKNLKRTSLYNVHVENGAKFTPYSGWEMPLLYSDSIIQSVQWCRSHASLFDVSHMGQVRIEGRDGQKFIEHLTVADFNQIPVGNAHYTLMTNQNGGIIDDTIITNFGDYTNVVLNAGCFEKDFAYLKEQVAQWNNVQLTHISDHSLIALQGPMAEESLNKLTESSISDMTFMTSRKVKILGTECVVQRSGYTGEDGFEVSIPSEKVEEITKALLENQNVKLSGLAARDTLRLEAGLSLYGNDIDETITPKQAGLIWAISKRRRAEGGFVGAQIILDEINGTKDCPLRRVGLVVEGAPARKGTKILNPEDKSEIGEVTSGTFSPTLNKAIALGFVDQNFIKSGTKVLTNVRGKLGDAEVAKLPFVPHNYKR